MIGLGGGPPNQGFMTIWSASPQDTEQWRLSLTAHPVISWMSLAVGEAVAGT